jgi:nucleotide-binding universal stress UspA family protein
VPESPQQSAGIGRPAEERNRQWRLLDEARQSLARRGIEIDAAARVGDAAAEVLAVADDVGADVVVVGRRRGKAAHVHGSISGRIVRDARCDVLVVHADGA